MDLDILGDIYRFPLKLMGSSSALGKKEVGVRGPHAKPEDFKPYQNYISDAEAENPPLKVMRNTTKSGPNEMPRWLQESTTLHIDSEIKLENTDKIDQYMAIKQNKDTYNKFLRDQRGSRVKEERMIAKMKSTGQRPTYSLQDIFDKKDVDLGMDFIMEPPKLNLPQEVDPLFVIKPIGKYEP